MGAPSYSDALREIAGMPASRRPGESFWNSTGMITPPTNASTLLTPEQRFARDYPNRQGDTRAMIYGSGRAPGYILPSERRRIMADYQNQYQADLRGGIADPELGSAYVQFK
jgi:hypothetical protein